MHAYLFNARTLQPTNNATFTNGSLVIYTVFIPERFVFFDAVFFVSNSFQNANVLHTQCLFIETMPKKIDPETNKDIFLTFEQRIAFPQTKEADLPDSLVNEVMINAIDINEEKSSIN